MCGRFTLALGRAGLMEAFPGFDVPEDLPTRYNIAPSQAVPVIANQGAQRVELFRWGLIPSWAKDPAIGNKMINARAETLTEKPAFRAAYRRRRCLILADGFYEWQAQAGSRTKTPFYFKLASGKAFGFAGLWEFWQSAAGDEICSCTIITTDANALVASVHDRMPVILPPEAHAAWLDPAEIDPAVLNSWLKPYPAEAMTTYTVSAAVNSPQNDSPVCIVPTAA